MTGACALPPRALTLTPAWRDGAIDRAGRAVGGGSVRCWHLGPGVAQENCPWEQQPDRGHRERVPPHPRQVAQPAHARARRERAPARREAMQRGPRGPQPPLGAARARSAEHACAGLRTSVGRLQ
jgi:hypothetical protein